MFYHIYFLCLYTFPLRLKLAHFLSLSLSLPKSSFTLRRGVNFESI